ncbi:MAG TPA: hypothetical protein VIG64_07130 [Actinomycetota bacterium]|jgi:Tol biopolymer transport system component/Ca2+-binding RTX toxin-like protein
MGVFGRGSAIGLLVALVVGSGVVPARAQDQSCRGQRATIIGTAGKDKIQGTAGPDVIAALAGDDQVESLAGNDVVCLGPGNDRALGGAGDDALYGDADSDLLDGQEGDDTLDVSPAPTNQSGFIGDGFGAEPGNDTYIGSGAPAPNFTRLSFDEVETPVTIDLRQGIATGAGNDTLTGIGGITGGTADDRLVADDQTIFLGGLDGNDVLIGGAASETLVGYLGDDRIEGGDGDDDIQPDVGDDGNDTVDGGAGVDQVRYPGHLPLDVDLQEGTVTGRGSDSLAGIENVFGGDGDDVIRGDDGPNVLDGDNGDDVIEGRAGADDLRGTTVSGGDGDDVLRGNAGNDTLDGSAGSDTVRFQDPTEADLREGTAQGQGRDRLVAIEVLEGSPDRDVLRGSDGPDRILGGDGRDELDGRGGDDVLDGEGDTDLCLNGEATSGCELFEEPAPPPGAADCSSNDALVGTNGDDELIGTTGDDVICGLGGDDSITGGEGNDVLVGGDGDDDMSGGDGNDVQKGDDGRDALQGGDGFDLCFPGAGDDEVGGCERCGNVAAASAIAFSRIGTKKEGLYKIASSGRRARRLTRGLEPPFEAHAYEPDWSPDGRTIAFNGGDDPAIYTIRANGKGMDRVARADHASFTPDWSPDGTHLVFEAESEEETFDIFASRRDGSDLTRLTESESGRLHPSYSPDGTQIATEGNTDDYRSRAFAMNADGSAEYMLTSAQASLNPAWSPTGEWIAFTSSPTEPRDVDATAEIYVVHESGFGLTRLTHNAFRDASPEWSPDGSQIAFTRTEGRRTSIVVMDADGSNERRLTSGRGDDGDAQWSPDGTHIAFVHGGPSFTSTIRIMRADGTKEKQLDDPGRANDSGPQWQPKACAAS